MNEKTMNEQTLIETLNARGTPWVRLDEACDTCGGHIFYFRKGRKHNGCVGCKQSATANNEATSELNLADENGVPVYIGKRACSKCGSKTRLVGNAYGANKGRCRDCAVADDMMKQHGKEFGRVARAVNKALNGFIVHSIERSKTELVAPRTMGEYLDVRDLMYKCMHLNSLNKSLGIDEQYDVAHWYPASGNGGDLRGKATVDNLYLEVRGTNRSMKAALPGEWSDEQVVRISVADAVLIQNSWEAHAAWKAIKPVQMTEEQAKDWETKDKAKHEEHKALVREITRGAVDTIKVLEMDGFFDHHLRNLEAHWLREQNKMARKIDAAYKGGEKVRFLGHNQERLTIDAFVNANARMFAVLQTLRQIEDGISILREQHPDMDAEMEGQVMTLKRQAAMWSEDVLNYPRDLVMGFTSPLLRVLGDQLMWGTVKGEDGNEWMCAWKDGEELRASLSETLCPYYEDGSQSTPIDFDAEGVNSVLRTTATANHEYFSESDKPDFIFGPDNVKREYVHEAVLNKRARMAREAIEAETKAKVLAKVETLRTELLGGFSEVYDYVGEHAEDQYQLADAMNVVHDIQEWAQTKARELDRVTTEKEFEAVAASARYSRWMKWKNNPREIMLSLPAPF